MLDNDFLISDFINTFDASILYFKHESENIDQVIIDENVYNNLAIDVLMDVIEYCKDNNVQIKNFDDYKIVYFLGQRLWRLSGEREFLIEMVNILHTLLYISTNETMRVSNDMILKIKESIKNDCWHELFGKYGIYSIFKVCSKLEHTHPNLSSNQRNNQPKQPSPSKVR